MNYTKVQQKLLACKEKLFYCPVFNNDCTMYYSGHWGVVVPNVYNKLNPEMMGEYREAEKYIPWKTTELLLSFRAVRPMHRNGKPSETYEFYEERTGTAVYVNPDCFKVFDFHAQYAVLFAASPTGPLVVFEEDRRTHDTDWTNPKGFVMPERWNK